MHIKLCFTVSLALALAGCIKISNDDEPKGTTKGQAAEALTKAMSFDGGERVAGLMPDGDSTDVMLLAEDPGSVGPGSASLMLMDFSPAEATVSAALVQFADAESHFLIDGSAFVEAGDGGASDAGASGSGGGHIELKFEIADDVCDELCATVYELEVMEALDLGKSGVTKHKTVKLKLDCREQGKKSLCSKENLEAATSGDEKMKDAGAQSDAGGDAGCTGDACTEPTVVLSFDCGDGFTKVSGEQLCDGNADCPGEDPIDESGSACTHCVDAVDTIYSIVMRCDGKDDCADRSDELDCERTCADGASFKLVSLCDGLDDCRDSSDELGCDGGEGQFACKDDSYVPVEFVCNGVTECLTAEDEADCTRAAVAGVADGAGGGTPPSGMSIEPADAGAQP